MFDEATGGDISGNPSSPLEFALAEGANTLSATTGNGDQEYVTVDVPEGFELASLTLQSYDGTDRVAFVGVQAGDTFTEPLDESANQGNLLGYTLFGNAGQVGTDLLDNIGNGAGAEGFDGPLPAGTYTFALQQLGEPTTYTLDFNLAAVTEEPPTESPTEPPTEPPVTGEPPVVSFETVPATFSEEDPNNLVEWKWTVTGDFPAEGLTINLDTSGGGGSFAFTDQFATTPEAEFINSDIVGFDDATGRLNILLSEPEASFKLYFIDDILEEGTQEFDFQLVDGDGYTVDPDTNGGLFTITDDNGGPGVGPTIGLTTSATELAEGDTFTVTFTAEGDIPAEGVQVLVQGDVPGALGQFDLADLGNITTTGMEGLPTVGDGGGGSFFITMTEPTATITLDVFDDILAEEPLPITFTVANGEEYEVDPANPSIALTIADEVQLAGPTVGLTVDKSDVTEGETITLTLTVDGDIPADGVQVLINDTNGAQNQLRSLTEFDVANIELTGIEDFPSPADGDSGFFVTLTEPTATITLPVFDDGADEDEALESFTFEVIDGEAYEVDAAAGSITLNISDAVGGNPPTEPPTEPPATPGVVTDNDSVGGNDDIIANAQTIDLTADNPLVQVQASIAQRFEDRGNTADATEDVDMFAVELNAGDVITIDADSVTTELEGFQVGPAPDITIFNAAGEKIVVGTDEEGEDIFAFSSRDGAPDEAFVANRDAYLEFTAPADGTYYIGASQYRNNSYDANVVGSGSGAFFSPRFGVSPGGEYTLDIALNPTGFDGDVYEEFTGTPEAGSPIVSLSTDPGTFVRADNRDDIVISSELIESSDEGRGTLGVAFSVEGDIPEGGLEVLVKNEEGVDLNDYFEGLSGQPRIVVGGSLTGGLYAADGSLIGFKALLTANNALFPFTAAANDVDDPNAPDSLTFSLANSADYAASDTAGASDVTIYDDLAQVQANSGPVPEVGFTFNTTEFIESEGTEGIITVTVNGEIPDGGLQVYIDGDDPLLGEFDVFNAEVTGGSFPSPSGNASGFFFRVFENTATIKLSVFDETTNDQIPAEDALEGIESFSIALQPLDSYTIDPAAASVDFTIADNPDSVVIPDEGDGEGGDEGAEEPVIAVDTDSRDTINDTIETAVATGLTADNSTVSIEGGIEVRWRNEDEQKADNTEDVDLYSFDLAAGQTVNIGAESVPFELGGITQNTAATLRLFNAAGVELALSESMVEGGAVTEAAALEYTADAAGTYYVGVSQYLNDNYDPLVNASGDGVQLPDDGISPGEYKLDLVLTAGTEPPTTPPTAPPTDNLPVLSLTATPETLNEADADILTYNFSVEGDIPEGGLVFRTEDLFDVETNWRSFNFDEPDPATLGGVELVDFERIVADNGDATFQVIWRLLEPTGFLKLPVLDDNVADAPGNAFTVGLIAGEGYTLAPDASEVTIGIVDGIDNAGGPVISMTANTTSLNEGDLLTLSFNADGELPEGGQQIFIQSDVQNALGEFVTLGEDGNPILTSEGLSNIEPTFSGFIATMTSNTASISLNVFDDGPGEGPETFTYTLQDGETYDTSDNDSFTVTVNDTETVGTDDDEILEGTADNNSILGEGGNDTIAGGQGNDILLGGDGDDVLRGDDNSRDPQNGIGGNDIIFGGDGNDRIGGKAGNDILSGDSGDDFIWGDDGDDVIMGVTGNDTLVGDNGSGGSGSDLFVFGNGDGTDTIVDFEVGTDRIGLVSGELTFADLTITQDGSNTLLGVTSSGETLAVLNDVQASSLTESSFEVVPDVSNPNEAIALI